MPVRTETRTRDSARKAPPLDVYRIRRDFPILQTKSNGKPLVYLDNAATTQKPRAVIDALTRYYELENANIHRGVYQLSQLATTEYETARRKIAEFINAASDHEIIFTRGTTESINLVASSWGRAFLKAGDEVIISALEHHSNIVPWQIACDTAGAKLRVIPINEAGELEMDEYGRLLSSRTKMVAVNHVSNSLGTINPVREIIRRAHASGAKVLIDGAQWVAHHPTDVRELDADFYAFSSHKLYGPTGMGVLYGKSELLNAMPPYQGGGDMIRSVTFGKTEYADLPNKFEAGTPHIAGAVGLAAAIDFVQSVGLEQAAAHEAILLKRATEQLQAIPGVRLVGTAREKAAVISFVVDQPPVSSLDLGLRLDQKGIAVRTGHHCCQPVMDRFAIPGTARASLAMYNTLEEVDAFVEALKEIVADAAGKAAAPRAAAAARSNGDIQFPPSEADSPQAAAEQLAEDFEFLGDRDARNQYVLDLGEKLLPMPAEMKSEATRVHGCMSTVHLFGRRRPASEDRLDFLADSDAHIVRGLIGILQKLFAGQRAGDILAFDVEAFFNRIGLDQFVSTQRRNGLAGMVNRIRKLAAGIAS